MPRRAAAVPALVLAAAVLAPILVHGTPPASPATSPPQEPPPANRGLPPAPPPSGIRPSRKAEERRTQPPARRAGPVPRRATGRVMGEPLTLEVRGMEKDAADAALRAAVAEMRDAEGLLDPQGDADGGLSSLDSEAGGEPVKLDPRLVALLQRAESFCVWSGGAHGPLGGKIYDLWGFRSNALSASRPSPASLARAVDGAACDHLRIDPDSNSVQLAAGSRVELWGFRRGFLVDRAMSVLQEHGAKDAFVELGWVRRAIGSRDAEPNEEGRGWPVTLPVFPGQDKPLDHVWLRDESLAVASALHRPLLVGGDRYAPYLDQRDGEPAKGVVGVVAVTELGVDAEALAATMMILGNRQGLLIVGGLKPSPSVLWLLGGGEGVPLLAQYDWSRIALR